MAIRPQIEANKYKGYMERAESRDKGMEAQQKQGRSGDFSFKSGILRQMGRS